MKERAGSDWDKLIEEGSYSLLCALCITQLLPEEKAGLGFPELSH